MTVSGLRSSWSRSSSACSAGPGPASLPAGPTASGWCRRRRRDGRSGRWSRAADRRAPGRSRSSPASACSPSSSSCSSCSACSTPSAMRPMPRLWAIDTIARTISVSRWSRPRPSTKARSILRMSAWKRLRCASDEYPVPKSSMAMQTPSDRSAVSRSITRSTSPISTDSVTSRHSRSGSSPVSTRTRRTSSTMSSSPSWCGERLTDIVRRRSGSCRWSRTPSSQACRRTKAPSGWMSPDRSAIGTNRPGPIDPSSGCCQRTSASKPITLLWTASTFAW